MTKPLNKTKAAREKLLCARIDAAYKQGVNSHKSGKKDKNKYCVSNLLEMCAWSAGYFDSKRGIA